MKKVNYFVLGEIFNLLERVELLHQIPFERMDPDDPSDVGSIVTRFIHPALVATTRAKQDTIRWSLEYYCVTGTAPFDVLRYRCQELSLPDCDSPIEFFSRVGECLFPNDFACDANPQEYEEVLDEHEASLVFICV